MITIPQNSKSILALYQCTGLESRGLITGFCVGAVVGGIVGGEVIGVVVGAEEVVTDDGVYCLCVCEVFVGVTTEVSTVERSCDVGVEVHDRATTATNIVPNNSPFILYLFIILSLLSSASSQSPFPSPR